MQKIFGYVRVSSSEQNEDRQMLAMEKAGIPLENIFIDKKSGKDFERPKYKKMLKILKEGDVLYIVSIDRLGRNYEEIQKQWHLLTKKIKVDIAVLDMPLLDTRTGKDLLGTFIADLVLQILSYSAHHERDNIRKRQAEGIVAAKARGISFGRPKKPLPNNFNQIYREWKMKKITTMEASKRCGLSYSTFRKKVILYEQKLDSFPIIKGPSSYNY